MRWTVALALVGCTSKDSDGSFVVPDNDTGDADADTDTDTDSDADSDTDTDADTDTESCPFAGEWVIAEVACTSGGEGTPLELTGTASVTGTAELCRVTLDVVVEGCALVEVVELHVASFGWWEGYTDGAGNPACRSTEPGPRELGLVMVTELGSGDVQLEIEGSPEHYLQVTTCTLDQTVTLTPGA